MLVTIPGESAAYRTARNDLLKEEIALRSQLERVAGLRRSLPIGGALNEDYSFTGPKGEIIRMSDLISPDKSVLAIYSLMFSPDDASACPMCVSLLDGLNGQADHLGQSLDFVVVSAATPEQLSELSQDRGWSKLKMLSAQGSNYQRDYHGESPDGAPVPMINIFRKSPDGITHFWGSESFFADIEGHPRHLDQIWPLWNMLDLTPAGRGTDWYPRLSYID